MGVCETVAALEPGSRPLNFTFGKVHLQLGHAKFMATTATVSSKGQITLPKKLREKHHLTEGESVLVLDSTDGIVIRHARRSLRGLLKGKIHSEEFERDLKRLRREWRL